MHRLQPARRQPMRAIACSLFLAVASVMALHTPVAAENTLPWTISQEQDLIVTGLKLTYEIKTRGDTSFDLTAEVISANDTGFKLSLSRANDSATRQPEEGWGGNLEGSTLTLKWGELADIIKDATVGKKKL